MNRLRIALLAVFCSLWVTGLQPVHAETKSLIWERLDSEIVVREDGTLRVTETNVIRFTEGTFTFGYRDIDQSRLTAITEVEVVDEQGEPLRIETVITEKNRYRVKYFFNSPASDERRTFRLSYTVEGALRYYPGGDQLYWAAVFEDRGGFAVQNARTVVRLPAGAQADKAEAYGATARVSGVGENTLTFEAETPVDSGVAFEVRAQFPHGVVKGEAPPWQAAYDEKRVYDETVKPRNNLLVLLASLLVFLGGPALAIAIWVTRGRDPNVGLVAEYLTEPPKISPGLGGTVLDESADMKDIVASLFDLASRGVLALEQADPTDGGDTLIRRGENYSTALAPFEQRLVTALQVPGSGSVALGSLKNRFYANIDPIKADLYAELAEQKLYAADPTKTRASWSGIGMVVSAVSVIGGCVLTGLLGDMTDYGICLPIAGLATGIAFLVIAQHMPVRTRAGAEMRMRVAAFKRYMENIEKYTDVKAATDLFARYLPWAIAFGLERSWMHRFAAVDAPPPIWYTPYPSWRRPGYRRPIVAGAPAATGGPDSDIGDVSDAARAGSGGLAGLERGMAGGLANMEKNLAGMFESFTRTLESRPAPPPSSSRSSGSWSGGGSRGGGSSGGGGGGFG